MLRGLFLSTALIGSLALSVAGFASIGHAQDNAQTDISLQNNTDADTSIMDKLKDAGVDTDALLQQEQELDQEQEILDISTVNPMELSLNSAILFALHNNPDIEIFWSRYLQANSRIGEAESGFYPTVDFAALFGPEFKSPSAGTNPPGPAITYGGEYGINVSQMLFDGFETLEGLRNAEDLSEAAFWRVQTEVVTVLENTIETYLEILQTQKEVQILTELIEDVSGTLDNVRQRVEAGAEDQVVLDYASSRKSFADTELRRAQSSLNDAISRLEFLTGKLPPNFITFYPEKLFPYKLDLQFYLDYAEEHNSSLASTYYEMEAMKHTLEAEKAASFTPDVDLAITANEKHNSGGNIGRERELSATVNFSYNLFDGFSKKYARERVREQINEISVRRSKVKKATFRDIKQAYNQVVSTISSIASTEEEIESSIQLKRLNEEQFALGNINIIELIESAERLKQAKVRRVELETDMYMNTYRLLLLSNMIDQSFFCATC